MFDQASLLLFMTATVGFLLIPGPTVLYIVARSVEQGASAGFVSSVGTGLASIIHVLFAALGLSALLMQSAIAFNIVKYLGAAYLIYLGIRTWMSKAEAGHPREVEKMSLSRLLTQGFIVNLLNPKTALFFLAFLPQFVNPERGSVTLQILILGTIFVGLAIISDSLYAFLAGSAKNVLLGNVRLAKLQKNFAGTMYIGLGITAALSGEGS